MNREIAIERKISAAERRCEAARRRYTLQIIRLLELLMGTPWGPAFDATPRRRGPADFSDLKRRKVRKGG